MRRLLVLLAVLGAIPLSAHHGFGDYDPTRLLTLTGTVEQFSFEDPHSSLRLRVDGKSWYALLPSAAGLTRRALAREVFAPGTTLTLKGYPHKKDALHLRPEWLIRDGVEVSLRDARPPLKGETGTDWAALGEQIHGGFGSYIAFGLHIGLDALEQLQADPRSVRVTLVSGAAAPCPCIADGLMLATGATPGRGTLEVVQAGPGADDAAGDRAALAVVTITHRPSGRTLRYGVDADVRELLDGWNKLPAHERLAALRTLPSADLYTRTVVTP